jgi:hypothetical protein
LPFIAILGIYNTLCFGAPWALSQQYMVRRVWNANGEGLAGVNSLPDWEKFWGLTFSLKRGIFAYNPVFLLAPIGMVFATRHERKYRPILIFISFMMFANFSYNILLADWTSGSAFGPRYLVPTMSAWIIFAVYSTRTLPRFIWIPIAGVSVLINWSAAQYGFAESAVQHIQTLVTSGPILPAFAAILEHSTGANSITELVTRYRSILMLVYAVIICLLGIIIGWYLSKITRNVSKVEQANSKTSRELS